jgi:LmbE family N-acetylglucosaminyl deacetylase
LSPFDFESGQRWLFVFPHPDDELAILAFMRHLRRGGVQIRAIWMHSTPIREMESRSVMSDIGFSKEDLIFFRATDGHLVAELDRWQPELQKVATNFQPDVFVTCAYENGHLDHDATHFLVHRIAGKSAFREFPLYYSYNAPRLQWINEFSEFDPDNYFILDREDAIWKRMQARRYPSQNIYRTLVTYHAVCTCLCKPVRLARRELLRVASDYDFCRPAHGGVRGKWISRTREWQIWLQTMKRYESLGLNPAFPDRGGLIAQ